MESEMNPAGAEIKRGAFEITVTDEEGKTDLVWTGQKLGPPRRLKFPDVEKFIEDFNESSGAEFNKDYGDKTGKGKQENHNS